MSGMKNKNGMAKKILRFRIMMYNVLSNMIILYYFIYVCNGNCKIENVTAFTLYGHKITVLRCSGNQ